MLYRSTLRFFSLASTALLLLLGVSRAEPAAILVKNGQTVAFIGDSITQGGWSHPYGYVRLVVHGLETAGIHVTPIPAGVNGNTSVSMLARLKTDILSKKPDWLTLSCGVNDVISGVDFEPYKKNITSIIEQTQAAGIQVLVLTSTRRGEEDNAYNQKLVVYNEFLRQIAKEKHCPMADLSAEEQAALAALHADPRQRYLTIDGVHMNPHGDRMMAVGVLKGFGLGDELLKKIEQAWLDAPNLGLVEATATFKTSAPMTLRQSDALEATAATNHHNLPSQLNDIYLKDLTEAIEASRDQNGVAHDLPSIQAVAQEKFAKDVNALLQPAAK